MLKNNHLEASNLLTELQEPTNDSNHLIIQETLQALNENFFLSQGYQVE